MPHLCRYRWRQSENHSPKNEALLHAYNANRDAPVAAGAFLFCGLDCVEVISPRLHHATALI